MQIKRKTSKKIQETSSSTTENHRGRKRHHSIDKIKMEDDGHSEMECHLEIPKVLKDILIEDWENITKDDQLVVLPAKVTVTDILDRYLQEYVKMNGNDEMLEQTIQGLKLYFNHILGTMLLYRSERKQYQALERYGKPWVDIYGAEHLLRLFVELPVMISQTNVDIETMEILKSTFMDILIFIQDNDQEFIVKNYQVNR